MTEPDWQAEMLRRLGDEPKPSPDPDRADPGRTPDGVPPAPPARRTPGRQQAPPQPPPQQPPPQQPQAPQPPPSRQPPSRQPPSRQPPSRQPPSRQPPSRQPPSRQPPSRQPGPGYPASPPPAQQLPPAYPPAQHTPPGGWGMPPAPQPGAAGDDGLLRSIGRFASQAAHYLGGGSGQVRRDVENIAAVRRPLPISRLIGVLSPVPEGGTSTVAALLADTLAAQRADRILVVDADPGEAELSRRLHVPGGRVELVRSAATVAGVRSALGGDEGTAARNFGLVLVDCPGTMTSDVSAWVGTTGHAFVVTLPSVPEVARHCLAELDRMSGDGQQLLVGRSVFAVCVVRPDDTDRTGWLAEELGRRGLRSVVLPFDPELAATVPLRPDRLRPGTLRATLALGARVVELCAG